jgi:hypothetical protein
MSNCNNCKKNIENKVSCYKCNFIVCKNCIQNYLLSEDNIINPNCINCKINFDFNFIKTNFPKNFIEEYRIYRSKIILSREKRFLPRLLSKIVYERDRNNSKLITKKEFDKLNYEYNLDFKSKIRLKYLRNKLRKIEEEETKYRYVDNEEKVTRFLYGNCEQNNCRGYIDINGLCGICGEKSHPNIMPYDNLSNNEVSNNNPYLFELMKNNNINYDEKFDNSYKQTWIIKRISTNNNLMSHLKNEIKEIDTIEIIDLTYNDIKLHLENYIPKLDEYFRTQYLYENKFTEENWLSEILIIEKEREIKSVLFKILSMYTTVVKFLLDNMLDKINKINLNYYMSKANLCEVEKQVDIDLEYFSEIKNNLENNPENILTLLDKIYIEKKELYEKYYELKNFRNAPYTLKLYRIIKEFLEKLKNNRYTLDKTKLINLINNLCIELENHKKLCMPIYIEKEPHILKKYRDIMIDTIKKINQIREYTNEQLLKVKDIHKNKIRTIDEQFRYATDTERKNHEVEIVQDEIQYWIECGTPRERMTSSKKVWNIIDGKEYRYRKKIDDELDAQFANNKNNQNKKESKISKIIKNNNITRSNIKKICQY